MLCLFTAYPTHAVVNNNVDYYAHSNTSNTFSYVNKNRLPESIKKFIHADEKILLYKKGDLNDDKKLDFIVVVEHPIENQQYGHTRSLIVFLTNKDNNSLKTIRNDNVIACSKCSNFDPFFDPFFDRRISIKSGKLSIVQNFDVRFHPSVAIYEFKYQPKERRFKTIKAKHAIYELAETGKYVLHLTDHIQEYGNTLEKFNPRWTELIGEQDKFYK